MSLIELIYVSTATEEIDAAGLDRILESAARHNQPQGVTGMLLYAGGSFMQVLEGEESAVDETMGRVVQDPRHTDIIVLCREPIAHRSFLQWNMGFRRLGASEGTTHPAYAPYFQNGFDAASIGAHPGLALEMLREFSLSQR